MFNPHPPLTGFPFVLLTLVVGAEAYGLLRRKNEVKAFARRLLVVVCCIAPLTYFAGYWGAEQASQTFSVDQDVISFHQTWAQVFLLCLMVTLLVSTLLGNPAAVDQSTLRPAWKKRIYLLYFLLLVGSYSLAITTSYFGGELVFKHGAAVRTPLPVRNPR